MKDVQVVHRPIIKGSQIDLQSDCTKELKIITTSARVSKLITNLEI
jgi:hypothetical protein